MRWLLPVLMACTGDVPDPSEPVDSDTARPLSFCTSTLLASSDPAFSPFPGDHFLSDDGTLHRVDELIETRLPLLGALAGQVESRRGFSALGPYLLRFPQPIGVPGDIIDGVVLFEEATSSLVPVHAQLGLDGTQLVVQPLRPLAQGTLALLALTTDYTYEGACVAPDEGMQETLLAQAHALRNAQLTPDVVSIVSRFPVQSEIERLRRIGVETADRATGGWTDMDCTDHDAFRRCDVRFGSEDRRGADGRVTAEATRAKDVQVIAATGEAEELLIKEIKQAEAKERVAEAHAREMLTLANAKVEEAERVAKAKVRIAEGVQAERAAPGLADVRVKEADAVATEKMGLAQARVVLEQKQSEAKGDEAKGLASMTVREKEIELEAMLQREKMVAEAQGKEADALAIEKMGAAEASAIKARMEAEAQGLTEKLAAMKAMEGPAKEHEEFRMKLGHDETIRLASIEAQKAIAEEQAKVLAESLGKADIQIMGGDGQFLDSLVKAASLGQAVDVFLDKSPVAKGALGQVLGAIGAKADDVDHDDAD